MKHYRMGSKTKPSSATSRVPNRKPTAEELESYLGGHPSTSEKPRSTTSFELFPAPLDYQQPPNKPVDIETKHVLDNLFGLKSNDKFYAFLMDHAKLGVHINDFALCKNKLRIGPFHKANSTYDVNDYQASLIAQLNDHDEFCIDNNVLMDVASPLLHCTKEDFDRFKKAVPSKPSNSTPAKPKSTLSKPSTPSKPLIADPPHDLTPLDLIRIMLHGETTNLSPSSTTDG